MAEKYVNDIVKPAIVDTFVLAKALKGNVSVDDINRDIRNLNLDLEGIDINECIEELTESGHLRKEGNVYRITDDGRQDVQKVLPWFRQLHERVGAVTPGMSR